MNLPLVADVMADRQHTSRSNPIGGHSIEFLSNTDCHHDRHHEELNSDGSDDAGDHCTNTPYDAVVCSVTVRVGVYDAPLYN